MNAMTPLPRAAMMDLAELAVVLDGTLHGEAAAFQRVATDTRSLEAGDLFVALTGERFDGHAFLDEARRRGASGALTSRCVEVPVPQVVVEDTRLALGRLAANWRGRFALPVVALTGSNGKTTVKEMLAAILAAHCGARAAVLATEGNLNNDIGMPLTLLGLREHHRFAVVEMGMNHAGEIEYLTRIARPSVALVNNAQRAHVGILGSVEAIAHAKGEIYLGIAAGGVAIVNRDDAFADYWLRLNAGRRAVTFGFDVRADVRATVEGAQVHFVTPRDAFTVRLAVAGAHNVRNALAACAAAHALEIPARAIGEGLGAFAGVPGRLQRRRGIADSWVIDDSYNANPESMKAALELLAHERGRKVFVMGDMAELGSGSAAMHAEVGEFARHAGVDALLALGPQSARAASAFGAAGRHFDDLEALRAAALEEARAGATLLVKGSRSMRMERVADALSAGGASDAL